MKPTLVGYDTAPGQVGGRYFGLLILEIGTLRNWISKKTQYSHTLIQGAMTVLMYLCISEDVK